MDIDFYLKSKCVNTSITKSPMRREFINRLNMLILTIGDYLKSNPEISREVVERHITSKFILTKQSVPNYINYLIDSDIFVYNPVKKTFSLPETVTKDKEDTEIREQENAQ